jgi:hypothetical protein
LGAGQSEKRLLACQVQRHPDVIISQTANGWRSEAEMVRQLEWLLDRDGGELLLLVLDGYQPHRTLDLHRRAGEVNIDLFFVPVSRTSRFRPLHVCIFEEFKALSGTVRQRQFDVQVSLAPSRTIILRENEVRLFGVPHCRGWLSLLIRREGCISSCSTTVRGSRYIMVNLNLSVSGESSIQ